MVHHGQQHSVRGPGPAGDGTLILRHSLQPAHSHHAQAGRVATGTFMALCVNY